MCNDPHQGENKTPTKKKHWLVARIEQCADIVKNLTIIVGVFTGIIALFYSQFDRRVNRALDFSKEYSSSIRSHYVSAIGGWNKFALTNDEFLKKSPAEMETLVVSFFGSNAEASKSLDSLLDFYDTLYVCTRSRSCDRNSVIELFGKQINNVFEVSAFYIFGRRKIENDPSIGEGLENLYELKPESFILRYL